MSVGGPQSRALRRFGERIYEVTGSMVYQVGSSAWSKDFRDVDLVVMLEDDEFFGYFGTAAPPFEASSSWSLACDALSALGEKETGLPIDFKFQPISWANEHHTGGRRNPLFALEKVVAPMSPLDVKVNRMALESALKPDNVDDRQTDG